MRRNYLPQANNISMVAFDIDVAAHAKIAVETEEYLKRGKSITPVPSGRVAPEDAPRERGFVLNVEKVLEQEAALCS